MICKNCGGEFDDTLKVCPICGKSVESSEKEPSVEDQQPAENKTPPKKPKKMIAILSVISVVLAASIVISACFWDKLSNTVAKTFLPAEEYYAHVEKLNVENTVSMIYDTFDPKGIKASETIKEGVSGSVKVEFGDSMKEFYEILDMEGQLDWIEEIELAFDSDYAADLADVELFANLNGTEIISGISVINMKDGNVYVTLPGIFEKYIEIPLDIYGTEAEKAEVEEMQKMMEEIKAAIPSEKVASQLLTKYFDLIVDSVYKAEKTSTKLEVMGVSQSCTLVTVTIDGKTIIKALTSVLSEAKTDKGIKTIIYDMAEAVGEDPDEVYYSFAEGIEEALSSIESIDTEEIDYSIGGEITFKNWINDEGEIIGRCIESGQLVVMLASVEDGTSIASQNYVMAGGMKMFELKGNGKKAMNGMVTADYSLYVQGKEMLGIEVKNFDSKASENDGYLNGEFYFALGDDFLTEEILPEVDYPELIPIIENLRLGFVVKTNDKGFSLSTMILKNSDPYITCTISGNVKDYSISTIPSESEIVSSTDEEAMQAMLENIPLEAVVEELISKLEKAGVPSELINALLSGEESVYQ